MPESRIAFLTRSSFLFWIYIAVTVAVSLHRYFLGPDHYGNYLIFKNSFVHLVNGNDLYALYPDLGIDLYKYSPTFAVLFAPLALLPDYTGLVVWNGANAMFLILAVQSIALEERKRVFILWFILIELITSLQNFQSNGLTVALLVFVFSFLEKKKFLLAGICIALGFYIKLFGILAAVLWFLYEGKGRLFISVLVSMVLLLVAPLVFVSVNELIEIYSSWLQLLSTDKAHSLNHSVMSVLRNWFGMSVENTVVQRIGAVLLLLPLLKYRNFSEFRFRLAFLSSVLIWAVIFNHKAESPTFIIAVAGCAIWFFSNGKKEADQYWMILLFILTCLSPTDIFPRTIRENYIVPYSLKVVPCILIWIRIQFDLLTFRAQEEGGS